MLDVIKEHLKSFFESRLLPIAVVFVLLFIVLINRMFQLQIAQTDNYAGKAAKRTEATKIIKASRGNIYDCNGVLLAYNKLSYNVTYTATEKSDNLKSEQKNEIIYHLIKILERSGEKLSLEFYIQYDKRGIPEFTISGNTLLRFKAEVFGTTVEKLTQERRDMSAADIFEFLRSDESSDSPKFLIDDKYDKDMTLQIMAVRYAMFINRFRKHQSIVLAQDVSDETVAAIKESNNEMPGVDIEEDSIRVYKKSKYFAHVIGYTGSVSVEKLAELQEEDPNTSYTTADQIGISGLESTCEEYLRGEKGREKLTINETTYRIESTEREKEPIAGNDIYLTIDSKMQEECYKLLEEHIAGVLIANINNSASAGSKGQSASKIKVPIYDVYSALIENNIINSSRFTDKDASPLEKSTYEKYKQKSKEIKKRMKRILSVNSKITEKQLSDSMAEFVDYFYQALKDDKTILVDDVDSSDATFNKYVDKKISLSQFLQYAISKSWVDLGKLDIGKQYFSVEEIYQKLVSYGMELLENDTKYPKMVYSYMIHQYELSGRDCCLLLFDQGDIKYNADEYEKLKLGLTSPYSFIIKKIRNLEITPGDLGLEPCSGALVVTDVNTGKVKAMVSYPSYDNNKMANQVDSDYFYNYLTQATSSPLLNRTVQQELAPGSTYKIVSAVAGLEEGIITPSTNVYDRVVFDKVSERPPRCWKSSGHGNLHVSTAIEASCNYFFYNVGFELGYGKPNGSVNHTKGLARLEKYSDMFGLTDKSGVEISESTPQFSKTDIVRSAIGQATHAYAPAQIARYVTTVANGGTCYDLTLIDKVKNINGKVILDNKAKVRNKVEIKNSTWDNIHEGMYRVANGGGSSISSMFAGLSKKVAGKTGTAQQNEYHANHAWFMSYAPYANPEISVTCLIPNGYASSNAAQTVRDVYKYYFSKNKKKVSGKVKMPESSTNTMD